MTLGSARASRPRAKGDVAASQPRWWKQLLLSSFILFYFYPPGAAIAIDSLAPGTAGSTRTCREEPTIADAPLQAGGCSTAGLGDGEEPRLQGQASVLLHPGKGRPDFGSNQAKGS